MSEAFPLDAVIANDELERRPARRVRAAEEKRAMEALSAALAGSPRKVLQALSDTALELCRAHSTGISILEEQDGRKVFRWRAVSGQFSCYLWNTLPRDFSPCGTVLDRKAAQLMVLPERHFTPVAQISPKIEEALLVPFSVAGDLVGTVWIVSHDPGRRFDKEDHRIVERLAKFAAQAYEKLLSLREEDVAQLARMHRPE